MSNVNFVNNLGKIAKKKGKLYKSAFMDLPNETIYWDPMGWRTRDGVNLKKDMWEAYQETGAVEEFDRLQREGWPFRETMNRIAKVYTGTWSLPTFHQPEIHVAQVNKTPAADLISRQTTDSEIVNVTTQDSEPGVEWGLENAGSAQASYTYNDPSYSDNTYSVVGYGMATRTSDKMFLANDPIRNTQSVIEQAQAVGLREAEDKQILRGTNNNASGFTGFEDGGTQFATVASPSVSNLINVMDQVENNGGSKDSMAVFCDFETHRDLRKEIDDEIRYTNPNAEIDAGLKAFTFEDVPVMKTNSISNRSNLGTNVAYLWAVDMSAVYMGMLQDMTVRPLPKQGPSQEIATDAYGTLAIEDSSKIQYLQTS